MPLTLSESDKLLFTNKEDRYFEFKMFQYKRDIQRQLGDIQTQLEELKQIQ